MLEDELVKPSAVCMVHLFAVAALRSKPALVARHTVVIVFVWDESLGTDGLVTAVTHETVLVPRGAVVLQHPRSYQRKRVNVNHVLTQEFCRVQRFHLV